MVGAVVARAGEVVAAGYHARAGEAHAEVRALAVAGEAARGADLFVTLEPCTVHGRTPPCVDAVIAARRAAWLWPCSTPTRRCRGRGVAALEAAGIPVEVGVRGAEAERLNRFYLTHTRSGLPFVTVKFAASLDGRIATHAGESRWISSVAVARDGARPAPSPRRRARRGHHGPGRRPALTVAPSRRRPPAGPRRAGQFPCGRRHRPSLRCRWAERCSSPRPRAAPGARAEALEAVGRRDPPGCPRCRDGWTCARCFVRWGERQVISVLAEGGAEVLGSLRDQGLIDLVVAVLATRLIGGAAAPGRGRRSRAQPPWPRRMAAR